MGFFQVKDCAITIISTGIKARMLSEFRDKLAIINPGSIYFHFWGGRLSTQFEYRDYHNDFAHWAHKCMHDDFLGERLELVNPTDYVNMESLRTHLLEIIDDRLDEIDYVPGSTHEDQFHFIRSEIVVTNSKFQMKDPKELVQTIPKLSTSSLFYHFIDARRRNDSGEDDFSIWLKSYNGKYSELLEKIKSIDPYFISLTNVHAKLNIIVSEFFLKDES